MSIASDSQAVGFDAARLIQTHQVGIWRYLRSLGCTAHEADDLTQDTFVTVLERAFQDYSDASTAAYLRRAAYHRFVSLRRRQGREVPCEDLERLTDWWTRWAGHDQGEELLGHLRQCLRRLTERARRSLDYRFRDQLSRAEIAERLSLSEDGAKNLMQRAKQRLRRCVEEKMRHESNTR